MAEPLYVDIDRATIENTYYRRVIYTDVKMQVVLMSLLPGQEIGLERHITSSQFFRCEGGVGMAYIGDTSSDSVMMAYPLVKDAVIVVPLGKWHNIVNTSDGERLQLYTVYARPQHPADTIEQFKEE